MIAECISKVAYEFHEVFDDGTGEWLFIGVDPNIVGNDLENYITEGYKKIFESEEFWISAKQAIENVRENMESS